MSDVEIGLLVGDRYRVTRLLGAGGMGVVYEAVDKMDPRWRVAIKFLSPQLSKSREWCQRFEREVKAGSALNTDYIARIFASGAMPVRGGRRRPWIVFEYLDGEPLAARIEREGPIAFRDVAWMLEHLLQGLEVAHGAGLVHRDIKPANLFLEACGRLRILDFGIAKYLRGGPSTMAALTSIEKILGSQQYMSPEQFANATDVDGRADLYSAGLVAYQLLTGVLPLERRVAKAITEVKTLARVPPLARFTGVEWPAELDAWVQRMTAPRRDDRFRTASEALVQWRAACELVKGREPMIEKARNPGAAGPSGADTVTAVRSSIPRR